MALYKSPLTIDGEVTTEECVMSHMTKHGVKYVQIYGVDNAIVRVGEDRESGVRLLVIIKSLSSKHHYQSIIIKSSSLPFLVPFLASIDHSLITLGARSRDVRPVHP